MNFEKKKGVVMAISKDNLTRKKGTPILSVTCLAYCQPQITASNNWERISKRIMEKLCMCSASLLSRSCPVYNERVRRWECLTTTQSTQKKTRSWQISFSISWPIKQTENWNNEANLKSWRNREQIHREEQNGSLDEHIASLN